MFKLGTRRPLQFISKIVLLLLLGMQVSFAFNAGFQFAATTQVHDDQATTAAPSCHSGLSANADLGRSLCRLHCVTDGQSLTHFDAPFLPPALEGAPILALEPDIAGRQVAPTSWREAVSHDPPIPIRFCSLLI